jgi:protein TonB
MFSFFSALFKAFILLSAVLSIHAILAWLLLLHPDTTPAKPVLSPVQVSFIQLQKPKPIKAQSKPTIAPKQIKPKPRPKITPKQIKPKPRPKIAPKQIKPKPRPKITPKREPEPKKTVKKPLEQVNKQSATPKHSAKTETQSPEIATTKPVLHSTHDMASQTDINSQNTGISSPPPKSVKKAKPQFNPIYLHQPEPPYTRILRRLNAQGTVKLKVIFAKQGHVKQVVIMNSSGSTRLDNHATQYVKKHWRYEPPQKLKQWSTVVPITFQLN